MEKVLEKKVKKEEVNRRVDPGLEAIEKLVVLNGALTEQVKALSNELGDLKHRIDQVSIRLGL